MTIRVNSFFAGIGGFDIGFERAGGTPVFQCEINAYCLDILARHWPTVARHEDIKKLDTSVLPEAEIWCGGFPCQDVSVARGAMGREGLRGKNSGLFYPFIELVKQRKPKIVLLENVLGLLSSHDGRDFSTVISNLTSLGYGVAWRVFNTRYFGAPQSRPRVYICAWMDDLASAIDSLYEPEGYSKPGNQREGFLKVYKCKHTGAIVPEISYCLAATSGRHTGTDWSRTYISYFDRVRRMTPTECEGLQGFPKGWTIPSPAFGLSQDEVDTLRYHALGNAVSTPVVEWVAHRIIALLKSTKNLNAPQVGDEQHLNDILNLYHEFKPALSRHNEMYNFDSMAQSVKIKWKRGGAAWGCHIADIVASPSPLQPISSRLIEVIEKRDVSEHYYISANAAQGIIRRVSSQGRVLFNPLYEALLRLAGNGKGKRITISNRGEDYN